MLKQLLWKEWREGLWKLGFGLTVSLAFTVLLFRVRLFPDLSNAVIISLVQVLGIPLIISLDLFAGEMSHGTIHLLFKIPVPRWQIFAGKMLMGLLQVALIFICTGVAMELMGHGREAETGMLFRMNGLLGLCSILLMIWFSVFAAQSRSEAGSLAALFGVIVGWSIVWLWAGLCHISWAYHAVPFVVGHWAIRGGMISEDVEWFSVGQLLISQGCLSVLALTLAGYRYVKIRRSL